MSELHVLRSLLLGRSTAALATLHDGRPAASMIPFATLVSGAGPLVVTHVSGLAAHTRDMRSSPEVSLLVTGPEAAESMPQSLPRVSLSARAEFIPLDHPDYPVLKAGYLAKFPRPPTCSSSVTFRSWSSGPSRPGSWPASPGRSRWCRKRSPRRSSGSRRREVQGVV